MRQYRVPKTAVARLECLLLGGASRAVLRVLTPIAGGQAFALRSITDFPRVKRRESDELGYRIEAVTHLEIDEYDDNLIVVFTRVFVVPDPSGGRSTSTLQV